MKKTILGIGLLVLSGLVLFQQYLPDLGLSWWKLVLVVFLALGLISGLVKRSLSSSFFCGIWLFILLNEVYQWLTLGTGTIIFGGLLACIGCSLLLKPKKWSFFPRNVRGISDGKSVAFGSTTRYINDVNFTYDRAEVDFGSASVYFDNAVMAGDSAVFEVEVAFSSLSLYVPAQWEVVVEVENVLSRIHQEPNPPVFEKTLSVTGDVAFSELSIIRL